MASTSPGTMQLANCRAGADDEAVLELGVLVYTGSRAGDGGVWKREFIEVVSRFHLWWLFHGALVTVLQLVVHVSCLVTTALFKSLVYSCLYLYSLVTITSHTLLAQLLGVILIHCAEPNELHRTGCAPSKPQAEFFFTESPAQAASASNNFRVRTSTARRIAMHQCYVTVSSFVHASPQL